MGRGRGGDAGGLCSVYVDGTEETGGCAEHNSALGGVCAVPAPGVEVTNTPSNPGNGPSQCPRGFGADFAKPSWLISLDYQLSDDIFGYAKLAFGYRAGGLNFRGTNDSYAFSPFQPETVLEHEVGTKLTFFDRRVQFNLALFDDDYKNQQVTGGFLTPDGILVGLTDNAGQAKIDGLEAGAEGIEVSAGSKALCTRLLKIRPTMIPK